MTDEEGERDLVILQHKFLVEWAEGSEQTLTSTLGACGDPAGHSADRRPRDPLVLNRVHAPYTKEICDPIREVLEREGLVEKVL